MKSLLSLVSIMLCAQMLCTQSLHATVGLDSIQMQRLIDVSQQQLKSAQELLKQAKQDASSIERAAVVLDQLSKGLDQQIKPLQGSSTYNNALLKIQAEQAGATKFGEAPRPGESEEQAHARENFYQFQQQSHKASLEDSTNRDQLEQALAKAQPGFVPKLQAQAQLGEWQTNQRISAQLSELLAAIQGLRKDLKGSHDSNKPEGFGLFLSGATEQEQMLRKGLNHVP